MVLQLAQGKWQPLRSLTDEEGRFKMMAIDQRDSLQRAVWKDAIQFYPDAAGMEEWLHTQGVYNFVRANAHAHQTPP